MNTKFHIGRFYTIRAFLGKAKYRIKVTNIKNGCIYGYYLYWLPKAKRYTTGEHYTWHGEFDQISYVRKCKPFKIVKNENVL